MPLLHLLFHPMSQGLMHKFKKKATELALWFRVLRIEARNEKLSFFLLRRNVKGSLFFHLPIRIIEAAYYLFSLASSSPPSAFKITQFSVHSIFVKKILCALVYRFFLHFKKLKTKNLHFLCKECGNRSICLCIICPPLHQAYHNTQCGHFLARV